MKPKIAITVLACGTALLAASPALAGEPERPMPAPALTVLQAPFLALDPEKPKAEEALTESLTDEQLDELRGGETFMLTNQTLTAITTGNVINGDYVAGSISLSDFALSNFNGIGNLVINTGGQVSLQAGMNLTINVGD